MYFVASCESKVLVLFFFLGLENFKNEKKPKSVSTRLIILAERFEMNVKIFSLSVLFRLNAKYGDLVFIFKRTSRELGFGAEDFLAKFLTRKLIINREVID